MNKLILASRNKDKIEEMRSLVSGLGVEVLSALDFPHLEDVEEDQPTLEGNALKKARYVFNETGIPSLSDDTGLEVEALGGAPGVHTARYAGENASYQDNVDKLIKEMGGKKNRSAQFRSVLALVDNNQELTFEGVCSGNILDEEKGNEGFGYDPVFQPEGFNKSFAEMDSIIKNEISHRGRAIQKFVQHLSNLES